MALHHVTTPTLSHLLALLSRPPTGFFPRRTGLLVIDGLNALFDLDYPRYQFSTSTKTEQQKWQASRRYAVLGSLASALNRIAVLYNIAVIVTTGCVTRMRHESSVGAALVPGVGGTEWDSGIWNRLVVFRDFSGRFIGVQKCQGKNLISREQVGEVGRIFGFGMTVEGALHERLDGKVASGPLAAQAKSRSSPVKPRKRNIDEIADSEEEDVDEYGWAETDENAMAAEGLDDEQPAEAVPDPA